MAKSMQLLLDKKDSSQKLTLADIDRTVYSAMAVTPYLYEDWSEDHALNNLDFSVAGYIIRNMRGGQVPNDGS